MIIDNAGTYTLRYTATDDCGKTTTVDRELVVQAPVYGVYWDGSQNSQWTRIGKSALLAEPVPAVNNGTGSSPFDDIYPWSDVQIVEDANFGTLVAIPKYYYKWTRDGDSMQLEISENPSEGFLTSPAHADRGDGVGERDVVYVGRYHCCNTDYKSTSGDVPKSNVTKTNFRNNIHALGTDVWQYDFAMYWTIAMLYLVEFADWDSQTVIGRGCGNGSSKDNNGTTDSMQYHTGTTAANRTTYGQVQYRHIEGLWSNVYDWCDGIYVTNGNIYAIKNPSDFADSENGVLVGEGNITSQGSISKFTNPTLQGYEYALFPCETVNDDWGTYVCDRSNPSSTNSMMVVGGGYEQTLSDGLFCIRGYYVADSRRPVVGSRLMKLPNA